MTAERWIVTEHATLRYVKRIDGPLTNEQARECLAEQLPGAKLQEERTYLGTQRWLLPNNKAVAVVKLDLAMNAHVAVTVLRPGELYDPETAGEIVEAYRRALRAKQKIPAATPAPPLPSPVHAARRGEADCFAKYKELAAKYNALCNAYENVSAAARPRRERQPRR